MRAKLILIIGALCLLLTACTAPTTGRDDGSGDRFGNDSNSWRGSSPLEEEEEPVETEDDALPTGEDNIIVLPPGGNEPDPVEPTRDSTPRPDTTFRNQPAEKEFMTYLEKMREDFNVSSLRRDDELDEIALAHAKWSVKNNVLLAPTAVTETYRRSERVTKYGEALAATGGPNVALTAYNILIQDPATRRFMNDPDVERLGLGSWCISGNNCVFSVIVLTTDRSAGDFADEEDEDGSNPLNNWDGVIDQQYKSCEEVLAHNLGPYTKGVDPEYFWYFDINDDGITCDSLDADGPSNLPTPDDEAEATSSPPGDSASTTAEPTPSDD